jgi:sugar O-acyltransferase (sialic acid O-acetyltransferase NeuD family)
VNKNGRVILQGGGGHAHVVLDCLRAEGREVSAIFDPQYHHGQLAGVPFLGRYNPDIEKDALMLIAIGNNQVRKEVVAATSHAFTNTVHPSVLFSSQSDMGTGNMILHGVIIQTGTRIGNHVIVNTRGQVDHHCVIRDFVHIGPGVTLCGNVSIGEGTLVGAGAVIIPGVKIGAWATVGAGSVVVRDVPDYAVAVGNPARVVKNLKP